MKKAKSYAVALVLILFSSGLVGCGSMFGLRKDLDDDQFSSLGPTAGGRWADSGMLDDVESRANSGREWNRGFSDRMPSSFQEAEQDYRVGDRSWVAKRQLTERAYDNVKSHDGDAPTDDAQEIAQRDATAVGSKVAKRAKARATRWDFVDEAKNDGSLWGSDGQANFFFTKNKVRAPGDIVTVVADADLVRDLNTEVLRTLTKEERSAELELAQQRLNSDAMKTSSSGSADRAPASKGDGAAKEEIEPKEATLADVDLSKSVGFKAGDPVMAEILERYPNGNYKIRGSKKVPYKGGFRYVTMLGIVRGQDIADDDTVQSGKLYEYRLEALR